MACLLGKGHGKNVAEKRKQAALLIKFAEKNFMTQYSYLDTQLSLRKNTSSNSKWSQVYNF